MKPFKLTKPTTGSIALVTGAGSGIGRSIAVRLSRMGYDIALVGLTKEALIETKDLINSECTERRCWILTIDLSNINSCEAVTQWCESEGLEPKVVVNNAGVFAFCDLLKLEVDSIERLLMLHCVTLTKLTRHFAGRMANNGGGYILNMASYSQWMPFPGLSLYGASKAYVKGFSVAFSKEVEEDNVIITAISPAGVATQLYGLPENLQRLGVRLGALITADSCARRSLRALSRGRRHVVPDWWNRLFIPICYYMPGLMWRWLRRRTIKIQKKL